MSIEFKLPELGENIASGDIVSVLVREGDVIKRNQGVVELETDKAVIEVPCTQPGKVEKIHVGKGDTVKVGQVLLTIDEAAEPRESAPEKKTPPKQEASSKAKPRAESAPAESAAAVSTAREPAAEGGPIPAGPAARRLAREMGVDLSRIAGSGARGRITVEDVEAARSGPRASTMPAAPIGQPVTPPGTPGSDNWGSVRSEKMSKIRRTIAAQMVKSVNTAPHVTNFDDADITVLEQMRKSIPKGYLGPDIKLTSMPFVMKAVAAALRQHPVLNASIDDDNEHVIYKEYVNLGIAVDTPRGLVVPVMRGVDQMTIGQIAGELTKLAGKARDVSFGIEDLRGGTFTLSNLGAVGGIYSTPVINHPEVAILLLGRSRWMPVVRDGNVETRFMMPLSLSYDHRLVDGAAAARFLNQVIEYLETPAKLLITG
jgi:pyruvate dehydrogenase E2 component (dihydrolipoamide acetyltransferase)